MLGVELIFDKKWMDKQGDDIFNTMENIGKRILKRIKAVMAFSVCVPYSITVMIKDKDLKKFPKAFEKMLSDDFGVAKPKSIYSCSAKDISEASITPPEDMRSSSFLDEYFSKQPCDAKPKLPSVRNVLSGLLKEVPFKYSKDLSNHIRDAAKVVPMLKKMNALQSFWNQTLLVAMDDGYGMTEFLRSLWRLYSSLVIAEEYDENIPAPVEMHLSAQEPKTNNDLQDMSWELVFKNLKEMSESSVALIKTCPVLCLDISEWLNKLQTGEVKQHLRKLNAYSSNFTLIFKIPFMEEQAISYVREALGDIFSIHSIIVPPTKLESLVAYAKEQLVARGFSLEEDATEIVEKMILQEKSDGSFFGFKTVDKLVDKIIYEKAIVNSKGRKVDYEIVTSDIRSCVLKENRPQEDPFSELDKLIGMESVKKQIREIVAHIKTHKQISEKNNRSLERPAIHMMFTGNPGTGKTTVARIVASIFRKEGILRKGHYFEKHGLDLISEYVGGTAPKTSAICRDAYGSVLFIDEAYSIFTGDRPNKNEFGKEALATLIAEMENHRDDMCVIVAGYYDEMKVMLTGNSGLESRIPYHIDFPNYSKEELIKIFFVMVKSSGFKFEKALEDAVAEFFNKIPDSEINTKGFANARFVRNLFERTWGKAACRSRLGEENILLLASDFISATEGKEFRQLMEKESRKPIGFGV